MLIKLADFDDALAEKLKAQTQQTTGSKAVLKAAEDYLPLLWKLSEQEKEIADLRRKLAAAAQVIEGARSAAALLLERTGQGELL